MITRHGPQPAHTAREEFNPVSVRRMKHLRVVLDGMLVDCKVIPSILLPLLLCGKKQYGEKFLL